MTASIPDGINFNDLQSLAKEAAERESTEPSDLQKNPADMTREEMLDKCSEAMDAVNAIINDPLAHKVMVMQVITNLMEWHTHMGQNHIKEGDSDLAVGWLRDAGKFQAIMNLLTNVSVSNDDFTVTWYKGDAE